MLYFRTEYVIASSFCLKTCVTVLENILLLLIKGIAILE